MTISDYDLRTVLIGCFRYSLGRMTGMPSDTTRIIKNERDIFKKHDWELFVREIEQCKNLGMPCDLITWHDFRGFANNQIVNCTKNEKESEL